MATYVPPKRGVAHKFYVGLVDQANTKLLKTNPTIAAGDFQVSKDGGAFANLTTLPSANPASSRAVMIDLSATEMTADNIVVQCVDAAGAEWCDLLINIQTAARQIDDLAYPTVSGRSLDVSATGEAGVDWANVGSPTTVLDLSNTTIKTTQKVDVDTIKTNPVVNGGTITFPTNSTLASTTNITAGTITTTTNLTNDPAGVTTLLSRLSAARATKLDAISLRDATAQAGAAGSITLDASASATDNLYNGLWVVIESGTGAAQARLITGYTGATKVATVAPNWTTNPDATSVFALVSAAKISGVTLVDTLTTYTGNTPQTGDNFARLGAPAGASVSADIAAVKTETASIQSDTNDIQTRLPAALTIDGNIKADTLRVGGTLQTAGDIIGDTNDIQARLPAALVGGKMDANVGAISTDTVAADNLEAMLDGTGGVTLSAILGTDAITATTMATGSIDALALATDAVDEVTAAILATPSQKLVTDASGRVDVGAIVGDTTVTANIVRSFRSVVVDSCTTGSTTTAVNTSTLVGTVADQYKDRVITFATNTTTAALRGQSSTISASSLATPTVLTIVAMTTAAVSGDIFVIT